MWVNDADYDHITKKEIAWYVNTLTAVLSDRVSRCELGHILSGRFLQHGFVLLDVSDWCGRPRQKLQVKIISKLTTSDHDTPAAHI